MGDRWDVDSFIAKLEQAGESEVRRRLAANVYGPPTAEKRILVDQWLSDVAAERDVKRDEAANALVREANALASRANEIALAANNFALESNRIAERAERRAKTANEIAIAAIAIAIATAVASGLIGYLQSQNSSSAPASGSVSAPSSSES